MITALTVTTSVVSVWAANLIGRPGSDTLVGTDDDDTIFALGEMIELVMGLEVIRYFLESEMIPLSWRELGTATMQLVRVRM